MTSPINYAKLFGFESVAAAGIFAALYAPLTVWFFLLLIRHRSYVVFTLFIFCQIRFVAFIIRAILAGSETAAENLDLFIAGEVLFSVGFFGLLYGAYGLVMDRLAFCSIVPFDNILNRLMRSRIFFHLGLSTGVALGIVGIVETSNNSSSTIGSVLRKVSVIIFVVLTVLQAYQTVTLVIAERRDDLSERIRYLGTSMGARHGVLIFMLIAILLLLREIFIVATIGSTAKQNNEHLWYPLVALPELLCIILYAVPGLIPPNRSDVFNLPK
ncbi:MAG: hypothetical protein NXY57DRAFT_894969 [Lentinula lateritia]|uniref:RTA1 like protein n=1 Tax=Lentinula lateritia TaxID=40482 RepID=A0ABQ8V1R7_9AGAR|nr:MAG: hypothetical protein NXY57DRAFT_894969 [Lentinula lateritia]KAJ4469321.1 hypothetical protein C8R41DRAFT_897965 [Lentinula lateritia]